MKLLSGTMRFVVSGGLLAACLCGGPALAQQRDEYGAPVGYSSAYDDDGDIRQTVARVSDMAGSVSYSRGDDPDDWQPASRNVPLTIGDRLYAYDRSRVELQMHGGQFVRMGSRTDLSVLNLTDDTKQFAIQAGVAAFRIRRLGEDEVFEVDTPNAAITLERPGDYRVDVDDDGNTRVAVREGRADVASGRWSISLDRGDAVQIDGIDSPRYDTVAIGAPDGWDRWVREREARIAGSRSYEYVSDDIAGVDDLDEYGRWENIPSYGRAWTPTVVSVGWSPYRVGQWIWQDPWGWTWVSSEPWGWAPYHYGRWASYSSRWYWVPVARPVRSVRYSPALVAFVGGGPGWSATVGTGGSGYVGWFPLAPRDPYNRWWGSRVNGRATNVTYVNRTYVTVVNRNTFVSGGLVTNNFVRDRGVLRDVSAAPVLRGTLPLLPTREAIRIGTRPGAARAERPRGVAERPVVARMAPPAAPPTFQEKLVVIRENRGAPVAPGASAEIAVRGRGRQQAVTVVRPVAGESGRANLERRGEAPSSEPRPAPVAPGRGRSMSTTDRPVAPAPVVVPRDSAPGRSEAREVAPRPASRARENAAPSEQKQPSAAAPVERSVVGRPAAERAAPAAPAAVAAPSDRSRGRVSSAPPPAAARQEQPTTVQQNAPPANPTAAREASRGRKPAEKKSENDKKNAKDPKDKEKQEDQQR